jgi:hypothetical protein
LAAWIVAINLGAIALRSEYGAHVIQKDPCLLGGLMPAMNFPCILLIEDHAMFCTVDGFVPNSLTPRRCEAAFVARRQGLVG